MALNTGLRSAVYSAIALSAAILINLCLCAPAFALDSALTENEHGDWDNADDVLIYSERDFSGTLKRITDSKNGCFYIFIQLYDSRIKTANPDNLVISFRLKNSAGSYSFSANRNGFVNTNATVMKSIRLEANFERISESGGFCSILIGFELLNKTVNFNNKFDTSW